MRKSDSGLQPFSNQATSSSRDVIGTESVTSRAMLFLGGDLAPAGRHGRGLDRTRPETRQYGRDLGRAATEKRQGHRAGAALYDRAATFFGEPSMVESGLDLPDELVRV